MQPGVNFQRHVGDLRSELRQAYAELADVELRHRPDGRAQSWCGSALGPREALAEGAVHDQGAALERDPRQLPPLEQSPEGEVDAGIVDHEPRRALPRSDLQVVQPHVLRPSALVASCPDAAQVEGEAGDDAGHVLGRGHLEATVVGRQPTDGPFWAPGSCMRGAREVGDVLSDRDDGREQPDLVDAPLVEARDAKSGPHRRDRDVGVVVRERHAHVLQGQAVWLLRPFGIEAELPQVRREPEGYTGRVG